MAVLTEDQGDLYLVAKSAPLLKVKQKVKVLTSKQNAPKCTSGIFRVPFFGVGSKGNPTGNYQFEGPSPYLDTCPASK